MIVDDAELHAAEALLGTAAGRALLGCNWGTKVAHPSSPGECHRQAVQMVMLYDEGARHPVKLCQSHADLVVALTTPHE